MIKRMMPLRTLLALCCCGLLLPLATVQAQPAVDLEQQRIRIALSTEPPTLNSMISTNTVSFFVLGHIMEGLMQYGAGGELVGGVAERWQLREDGATFWLRKNARWSDGQPVTAQDFVFAWRQALLPATGSQYAFIFYPIANAEAVNRGELPVEQLGVEAVNDHRLEVRFARPCPYFLNLTAFMSYYPIRQDLFQSRGQRYAAEANDMLYNGPFMLTRWVHGAELLLEKNPHYWGRERVRLNAIDMAYVTSDTQAVFNLFQDGRVAFASLDEEGLGVALEKGYALKKFHTGAQYFLEFNFRPERVTANHALRRAVQAVFDPQELVNQVLATPANVPGQSLFPITVKGVKGRFRDEYPAPTVTRNLQQARALIEQAKAELGIEQLQLVLLAGDSPRAAREAEYFQYLLQQGLGVEVKIDTQMFKQYLQKMHAGDFDIAIAGWGPDFDDAITFGDLFASWNKNNRGHYASEEYDHWVRVAQQSSDQSERMAAMAELQRIIVEDVVIIPTFERGSIYVQQPQLKGVVRRLFAADPDYRYAWIER